VTPHGAPCGRAGRAQPMSERARWAARALVPIPRARRTHRGAEPSRHACGTGPLQGAAAPPRSDPSACRAERRTAARLCRPSWRRCPQRPQRPQARGPRRRPGRATPSSLRAQQLRAQAGSRFPCSLHPPGPSPRQPHRHLPEALRPHRRSPHPRLAFRSPRRLPPGLLARGAAARGALHEPLPTARRESSPSLVRCRTPFPRSQPRIGPSLVFCMSHSEADREKSNLRSSSMSMRKILRRTRTHLALASWQALLRPSHVHRSSQLARSA